MSIDDSALNMKIESALVVKELYHSWSTIDFKKLIETQDKLLDTRLFLFISLVANVALIAIILIRANMVCA